MKALTREINIINEATIQFPILSNGSGWISTEKQGLSVIESGQNLILFSLILKAIESAKQIICLQSFLIQDTAIVDALIKAFTEKGVRVFVLSSVEARLKQTIEEEEDFIRESYVNLLDSKFKNHFVHRSAESFHGKYILIDPTTDPRGFLCTNNFTETGFSKNPELAIELNREQCEELFKIFVYHFWEYATDEQTATNEFAKVKPVGKFSLPNLQSILLTSPNIQYNSINRSLLTAVNSAQRTISFSTFQLDLNTELLKAIMDKSKQNISVTLFCRPNEKQFNDQMKQLLEVGVHIYFHPLLHAKSLLVDSNEGYIFTSNLTGNGLETGLEMGIKLNNEQTKDLASIHQKWQELFPFKAIKVANVKDLNEVQIFKDKKLSLKVLLNEEKSDWIKIVKVSDLLSFFTRKFEIKDNSTKTLRVKLSAEIDDLPNKYKATGTEKFEVLEVDEGGGKKNQFMVLNDSFDVSDISAIQHSTDMKVYFNRKSN